MDDLVRWNWWISVGGGDEEDGFAGSGGGGEGGDGDDDGEEDGGGGGSHERSGFVLVNVTYVNLGKKNGVGIRFLEKDICF
ncbi:hypothetical protein Hanom_Chr17g01579501 [Helianthus anomalus]